MNPLAEQLNESIRTVNPHVYEMLSEIGRQIYFPKGILSQSAEAKKRATRFNATIGTAMAYGHAMVLPSVTASVPGLEPNDILLYAPSTGLAELRQAWKDKQLHDNPSLAAIPTSLPIVTNGLTHGLSLISEIFCEAGDVLIYPDMNWGNYALNYVVRRGLVPCYYSFFKDGCFNIEAFKEA